MKDTVAVPRWAKISALLFALLLALFALVHLTGGGLEHGQAATDTTESSQ